MKWTLWISRYKYQSLEIEEKQSLEEFDDLESSNFDESLLPERLVEMAQARAAGLEALERSLVVRLQVVHVLVEFHEEGRVEAIQMLMVGVRLRRRRLLLYVTALCCWEKKPIHLLSEHYSYIIIEKNKAPFSSDWAGFWMSSNKSLSRTFALLSMFLKYKYHMSALLALLLLLLLLLLFFCKNGSLA